MNQNTYNRSSFLFADQSFWSGAASVIDLFGTLNQLAINSSPTSEEADELAARADFLAVGDDVAEVMRYALLEPAPGGA